MQLHDPEVTTHGHGSRGALALPDMIRHGTLDVAFAPDLPALLRPAMLELMPDPARPVVPKGATVLKAARQRLVLRLGAPGLPEGTCIAKMFPLRNPVSRLRHRKYARREFLNALLARSRGMAAPEVFAFFQRRRFGLVAGSGLLVQDLRDHRDIAALATDRGDYPGAARCAVPALVRLYDLGINHVDARDENILIAPGSSDGAAYGVIDWQYARFYASRCDWLLEHLAAYFIRMAPNDARAALLADWVPALHLAAAHPLPLPTFTDRVKRLLDVRISTRARLRLRPLS